MSFFNDRPVASCLECLKIDTSIVKSDKDFPYTSEKSSVVSISTVYVSTYLPKVLSTNY